MMDNGGVETVVVRTTEPTILLEELKRMGLIPGRQTVETVVQFQLWVEDSTDLIQKVGRFRRLSGVRDARVLPTTEPGEE